MFLSLRALLLLTQVCNHFDKVSRPASDDDDDDDEHDEHDDDNDDDDDDDDDSDDDYDDDDYDSDSDDDNDDDDDSDDGDDYDDDDDDGDHDSDDVYDVLCLMDYHSPMPLTLTDSDDGCDVDTLLPPVLQDSFGIERRDLQQRIAELLSEREQSQQVQVVFRRYHHYHDVC